MTDDKIWYTIDTTPYRVKIDEPAPGPSGDRLRKYNALKLNIDRYKTMWGSEYDDGAVQVEYLSPGSDKKVWAVCIQCGKGRLVTYQGYHHLCKSCSKKRMSEETRKKMSNAKSGENHPMFGRHQSKESCIKNSCTQRGIPPEQFAGFTHDEHELFRKSEEYANWRIVVLERDNYTCQECGAHGGVQFEVHHIIPLHIHPEPEYSLNIDNGITLCKLCHDKINGREDEFYNKYTAIVKAKCGFKYDFLSSSVILEGLKKQNEPHSGQSSLFDF